jgi:GNAT superfamily N-acetyltransferase
MTFLRYGDIFLADEVGATPSEWSFGEATHARVVLPSCADAEVEMQRRGFVFVDRTLNVSIPLSKVTIDLKRFQRMPIVETRDYKEDIFRIAHESFTRDRRFHVAPKCNQDISAAVLRQWVDELGPTFVCLYHDKPIGFLNLMDNFVHLAAVEAKYRVTGAAMGLYAKAIEVARERGFKTLEGRISSLNTPVMNVYATFGAQFSEPQDVFLKDLRHDA